MNNYYVIYKNLTMLFLLIGLLLIAVNANAENELPYEINDLILTLQNNSSEDTLVYEANKEITVKFTDSKPQKNKSKVEFSLGNFSDPEYYLRKVKMDETENPDGSYTYSYIINIKQDLSNQADWYYFTIESKTPKNEIRGHFIVDGPGDMHHFKIFKDSNYSEETNEFGLGDTIYIEIVGKDYGEEFSTKKVLITDREKHKYVNSNIAMLEQLGDRFRFALDLTQTKKTFVSNMFYSIEVDLKQKKAKDKSFIGYRQIKILPENNNPDKQWIQLKWREVK